LKIDKPLNVKKYQYYYTENHKLFFKKYDFYKKEELNL